MQNNIQIFRNKEFGEVRVVDVKGEPWWVLMDVCTALGIRNHKMTAQRLDGDEVSLTDLIDRLGRQQKTTIISESGLYAVILRSDKPNAKQFRKWVTAEILPSIRKHGAYINEDVLRRMREDREYSEELLDILTAERNRNKTLLGRVEQLAPKALYHDIILQCPDAVQVSIIAKDYGMGAAAFNKLLHRLKIQFRIGRTWLLYQDYQGNGYTVTNTYTKNGITTLIHTCWTQKGRFWLYELLKSHGIVPMAERMAAHRQMTFDDVAV